jgi:hypothetical protein
MQLDADIPMSGEEMGDIAARLQASPPVAMR